MDETFDPKQTEQITKIVLKVINDQKETQSKKRNFQNKFFNAITKNWAVFIFFIGVLTAIIGWLFYEISPFQKFEEISRNQKLNQYKMKMAKRHIALGNSFLNTAQLEAARVEFDKALVIDESNIDAHFGKLKTEIFLPIENDGYNPEIVKKRLDAIFAEDSIDPHANVYLGDIYFEIDNDSALMYYNKALKADSGIAAAYFGKGVIFDTEYNIDSAISMYSKALSLSEWNQTYLSNLAYQYYKKKEFDKAINYYTESVERNSNFILNLFGLSSAYRFQGKLEYADYYSKYLIQFINNDNLMALSANSSNWFWNAGEDHVLFYDLPMKKCYAYYSAALTAYLQNDFEAADNYIEQAKALNSTNEQSVKILMAFDVDELADFNKTYSAQLIDFKVRYNL
jgi:tetratricopeptide (TPR) repeat protein